MTLKLKNHSISLDAVRALRKPLINPNVVYQKRLSKIDRFAIFITEKVGTIGFFLIIFLWTTCWFIWNTVAPLNLRFDPFPAFVLWLFISNMLQIFLMPLIMVGQNLQGKYSELRAEADFEVNVKAEREVEVIIKHLENQNELLTEIAEKLGVK